MTSGLEAGGEGLGADRFRAQGLVRTAGCFEWGPGRLGLVFWALGVVSLEAFTGEGALRGLLAETFKGMQITGDLRLNERPLSLRSQPGNPKPRSNLISVEPSSSYP